MPRKFNIGDFVVVDPKSRNPTLSKWLEISPLGVGVVNKCSRCPIDWAKHRHRYVYNVSPPYKKHKFREFYSWELNLVSRNEKKV